MLRMEGILLLTGLAWAGTTASFGSTPPGDLTALKRGAVAGYAKVLSAEYEDALAGAKGLQRAVGNLLEHPSSSSLHAARQAWLDARVPYLQTEAARFYDGPIDQVEG